MKKRYLELVNTFVNIPETNNAIINDTSEYSYLQSGGTSGIRTLDPLLAKPMPCTDSYIVRPSIIPVTAAVSPRRTLPPRLTAAMEKSPLSSDWIVATLRVENVV